MEDKIFEKLNDIDIKIAELPEKIFEKADKRYAPKRTAKIVDGIGYFIVIAVVSAGLVLVFK